MVLCFAVLEPLLLCLLTLLADFFSYFLSGLQSMYICGSRRLVSLRRLISDADALRASAQMNPA